MEIKEFYNGIAKKKGLPSFEEMDLEFGIGEIKEGNFSVKIAEKIVEKTNKYAEIMGEFLQPDGTSVDVLIEIKNMGEGDINKINTVFKELVLLNRNSLIAELENNEESILEFIKSAIAKWKEIKPLLREIIKKARDSWKIDIKVRDELGYMG